jgi:hypothetical protein
MSKQQKGSREAPFLLRINDWLAASRAKAAIVLKPCAALCEKKALFIFDRVLTNVFKAVECGPLLQQAVFSAVVGESGLAVR